MATFPSAFKKSFLAESVDVTTTHKSSDLTAAAVAVLDAKTYGVLDATAIAALNANSQIMIAQGSFHADKIGGNPLHGGYAESTKSKGIVPKWVSKIWKTDCVAALNDIVTVVAVPSADNVSSFSIGVNQFLRVDVKGSPALRFLNHNAYAIADSGNACQIGSQVYVDPRYVLAQWAIALAADPIVGPFLQVAYAVTTDGGATFTTVDPSTIANTAAWTTDDYAKITLTGAYVDTKFGNCSFDTRDHYELEPVQIIAGVLDESGDACAITGVTVTQVQNALQGTTSGETVLRDIILTERYLQNPFNQGNASSSRIREIEGGSDLLNSISRSVGYKVYNILHSVPRFNNPSGVFDNDQYHYQIFIKCTETADQVAFEALLAEIATLAGIPVESL